MLLALKSFMNILCRGIEYLLAALLAVMTLVILAQVFCRFVLNTGFYWSEELARYLFIWMSMLAASVAVYRKENLGITVFVDMLPSGGKKLCRVLVEIGCLVLFAHIAWYGWKILPIVGRQTSASLQVNMILPYTAVFASAVLMGLGTVLSLLEILSEKESVS